MKILHLLSSPYWSGPAEAVVALALEQRRQGHEVSVAVEKHRSSADFEELLEPKVLQAGVLDEGGLRLSVKSSSLEAIRDVLALRQRKVDVVHAHFSHDHVLARLAHGPWRLVRSIHAPRSLRWSLPRAHAYTVPFVELGMRLRSHRWMVLPPFVDPAFTPAESRAQVRDVLGLDGHPVIGMVSTFQASRHHAVGLDAFRILHRIVPTARLLLVGDGREGQAIRTRVSDLGLTASVIFSGYLRGAAFVRAVQACDSVWILGLGNDWSARAAAQARACSASVVAVDEGNLPAYADAVTERDPAAIAAATERLLRLPLAPLERPNFAGAVQQLLALYA